MEEATYQLLTYGRWWQWTWLVSLRFRPFASMDIASYYVWTSFDRSVGRGYLKDKLESR